MELNRRTLLERAGATAAVSTGAIAGCLGGGDSGGSDDGAGENDGDSEEAGSSLPSYARWLSWDEDEKATFYTYVDWAALDAAGEAGETTGNWSDEGAENELLDQEDVMLALPMMSVLVVAFVGGFGLVGTGLSGLLTTDESESSATGASTEFETTIDEILLVNDAIVMAGDVRADEIHDALTDAPEDDWSVAIQYEETDAIGEFAVYEPGEGASREQGGAIAVGADGIVIANGSDGGDAVGTLRGPIEASTGDGERAADRGGDFEWMLGQAGHGDTVFGGYGEFDDAGDVEGDVESVDGAELDELGDAKGVVSSLTIESETEWSGEFAAAFEELDGDAEAELEARLGASADEVSYEVDGNRVTASATWNEDVLDE
ncbi:hypothetical protein [Halosolutus gelatinilyticus]|uniref:hypothetical protein n=1 Tax=Halosolutus gelatinilyticus TaxID=2931975 RepID=UPI001FF28938|nr:hypothetical protein [Halosolutus gelatinilyticus]